ncbi:bifunctional serine/threonine-protein kinase/ABC transporter substrate-binding protein [Streptomyces griseiscabiei]|uniref:Bifunctional serine/threonine-protein kinase/ABC transporter substrate-binding protein n=1 Tax=Streptomyces griseiscabiei TaxID=2993540 RepID=A0ABU4L133_9ACTN|nr:bifunctional serine/threonine-protein kinase/ABC transporter substrate-binding protein [Streptomyces griseiscabiei]MBZ3905826.1 ABC transporter substrate-binding protein [Streptomyces griseiscabiei]MDX2909455.1 bifunctional serine/threonine-protein kinase/ABC transporter substrate-binding protein [Streptomyces griseiscabiei]
MERLLPADPSVIGGHRLAGRLGAGGMGVVYLARSPHGAWCALKVIRAEYAGDPGFRARFRREAELASRLTGRWTVPVVAADADARSPWLATAYVPGPSLAEAVALHGPWPEARLRGLGAALAEALESVHTAGLVHRDVKPANVLLAVDGPRLIDFGIARALGATALTTDGSVVGSPGYLSPEQARGRTVGPPSDVFSLGCVLARTATGRPPFGTGGAAAVLYRTVHEPADLDGLPEALDSTVRRCLEKDPERRPSMSELRADFGEFTSGDWLPAGLPALVAARAARVLDLPVPDPTVVVGPSPVDTPGTPVPPTRRRLLLAGAALGVTGAAGAGAWWRWGRGGAAGNTGSARRPRHVVALLGSPSDPFHTAHERGARLAVEEHNRDPRRTVDLVLRTADDHGTPAGSTRAATRLAADPEVSVVIAAGDGRTVTAALPPCTKARLTVLVTRADTEEFMAVNTTTALVLRSTLTLGPHPVLRHLNRVVKPARTVVVHDLATETEGLPTVRMATVYGKLDSETAVEEVAADEGFTEVARRIAARPRDAVLFAGVSPDRAAACARALPEAGHRGARVAGEHVLGAAFLAAGEGWRIGTGYTDANADPRTRAFAAAFRARHAGAAPGPWAAEAYDAVRFAAQGLASVGDDGRSALRSELLRRPWQGITRRIGFDASLQYFQVGDDSGGFLFRVSGGAARFVARSDDIGKRK